MDAKKLAENKNSLKEKFAAEKVSAPFELTEDLLEAFILAKKEPEKAFNALKRYNVYIITLIYIFNLEHCHRRKKLNVSRGVIFSKFFRSDLPLSSALEKFPFLLSS